MKNYGLKIISITVFTVLLFLQVKKFVLIKKRKYKKNCWTFLLFKLRKYHKGKRNSTWFSEGSCRQAVKRLSEAISTISVS